MVKTVKRSKWSNGQTVKTSESCKIGPFSFRSYCMRKRKICPFKMRRARLDGQTVKRCSTAGAWLVFLLEKKYYLEKLCKVNLAWTIFVHG